MKIPSPFPLVIAGVVSSVAGLFPVHATEVASTGLPLLFMSATDAREASGTLRFQANPLQYLGKIQRSTIHPTEFGDLFTPQETQEGPTPPMRALLSVPDPRGGYTVYFSKHHASVYDTTGNLGGTRASWTIYRAYTPDGHEMFDLQPVFKSPPADGRWMLETMMVQRADTGQIYQFVWSRDVPQGKDKLAIMRGFVSPDGEHWKPLKDGGALLRDHDAFGVIWDEPTHGFIDYQTTKQYLKSPKPFPDNAGPLERRVMSIRTSKDGLSWDRVEDASVTHTLKGVDGTILPDGIDGMDVEFYRMHGFSYYGRYVAMMDLYAGSLFHPGTHGNHLALEWWVSGDGIHWDRNWRGQDAGAATGYMIKMAPMHIGREMLWWITDEVWGLPEQRIASVGSLSNASFRTAAFKMPSTPLLLNATIPPGRGLFQQAYVMAEVLDADGHVVPGYEKEKCVLRSRDDTRLPLRWESRDATELSGQNVSLRFYMRDSRLYAVTTEQP